MTGALDVRRLLRAALVAIVLLGGCGDATGSSTAGLLEDGPIEPGRHRYVLRPECYGVARCPAGAGSAPAVDIEVTVPAGWDATLDFGLLHPSIPEGADLSSATGGPSGAGLVLGWTNAWAGLHSDPCTPIGHPGGHQIPDISVGPTVDDFVDAVLAHPTLGVTEATDVHLGPHEGRFFTLTAPSDLTGCENWRPWDPGFYAQGPGNVWEVWVMDVDTVRVVIVAQHFARTPVEVQEQLRAMAESVRLALHATAPQ